jgi:hypothetical protein
LLVQRACRAERIVASPEKAMAAEFEFRGHQNFAEKFLAAGFGGQQKATSLATI